jgi:hypothetical protein
VEHFFLVFILRDIVGVILSDGSCGIERRRMESLGLFFVSVIV